MSLNWSISDVVDWKKKQKKDRYTLECLIWATLSIGLGRLNEKTVDEFLYRINRFSVEVGPLAIKRGKSVVWTRQMLEPWFGLRTNVARMSNAAFDKHLRKLTGR